MHHVITLHSTFMITLQYYTHMNSMYTVQDNMYRNTVEKSLSSGESSDVIVHVQ